MSYVSYRTGRLDVESPVFKSLTDISKLFTKMSEQIASTGYVTLAYYYQETGGYTNEGDSRLGWTDLLNWRIEVSRYGYVLVAPTAKHLKKNPVQDAYDILQDSFGEDDCENNLIQSAMDHLRTVL